MADPLVPYVTNWGSDPVWQSSPPPEEPALAHFPAHTAYAANLTLEEFPETFVVAAAAHDVQFDADRKLWYCDIELEPGAT